MVEVSDLAWRGFPILCIVLGMFFNFYKLMTLIVKRLSHENIFVYFVVLSVTDIMVLVLPLLNEWLKNTLNFDLRSMSNGGCRVHMWLSEVAMDIPPWLLVVIAYERRAFLWYPVPVNSQYTRLTVELIIAGLIVLCMIRHQHFILATVHDTIIVSKEAFSTTTSSNYRRDSSEVLQSVCYMADDKSWMTMYVTEIFPVLNLLLRVVAPFACLTAFNASILCKLTKEKNCARRLKEMVDIEPPYWFASGVSQMERTVKITLSLTIMMLACGLPYSLYYILQRNAYGSQNQYCPWLWLVGNVLLYLNYTLVYPAFALQAEQILVIMRDIWRTPLATKRGTNIASLAPRISPEDHRKQVINHMSPV